MEELFESWDHFKDGLPSELEDKFCPKGRFRHDDGHGYFRVVPDIGSSSLVEAPVSAMCIVR